MSSSTVTHSDALAFFWWYDQQTTYTLNECDDIAFSFGPNTNDTSVTASPPYTMIVYPRAGLPQVLPAGNGSVPFIWTVSYPAATQLLISFVDSNGNPGGTGPLINVVASRDPANCLLPTTKPALTMSINPPNNPNTCQDIEFTPSGGVPPYTLTIQKAADQGVNITNFATTATWQNSLGAGGSMLFALSDSAGNYAQTSDLIFSQGGGDTSCFQRDIQPAGGVSKGTIIGSTIAGVLALLLAAAAFLFWKRRKQSRRDSFSSFDNHKSAISTNTSRRGHQHMPSQSSSYKLNDGSTAWNPNNPFNDQHSVHSLQALQPVKFRVLNPDTDSIITHSVPSSPIDNYSVDGTSDYTSASMRPNQGSYSSLSHTQHGAEWSATTSHTAGHARMNSLGDSPQLSQRRQSGNYARSNATSLSDLSQQDDLYPASMQRSASSYSNASRIGRAATPDTRIRVMQHEDAGRYDDIDTELPPVYQSPEHDQRETLGNYPTDQKR